MHKSKIISLFILLVITAWQPTKIFAAKAANEWQSHAAIRTTAQSFLNAFAKNNHQGRSEVALGKLDHRLRLKTCPVSLEAYMPPGSREIGNTTVGVRCPAASGWSIYVSARIDVFGPVLVARHPIPRETRIAESDLERVERNLADLPYGYYANAEPVTGQVAKRTIGSATVITPPMLKPPRLVQRGERVSIIAESGPMTIRSQGKALSDGKPGELIRIRAEGSDRIINGTVVSEGVVKVTL